MLKVLGHIALSAMMLLTVSGMTINMHYCQGHLYDLAVNSPAHSCCDVDDHAGVCHHDQDQQKSHHCDDKTVTIHSTGDYLVSGSSFQFEDDQSTDLLFPQMIMIAAPGTGHSASGRLLSYNKPPPTQEVILSRIQSFLI